MLSRTVSTVLACLLAASALSSLSAQSAAPAFDALSGAPFSNSAAQLAAASSAMPSNPDFDAQVLYEQGDYRIAADGRLSYQFRQIYRVDTTDGVKNWAEVSYEWDPWYEDLPQIHARVLQPDGNFTELDQEHARLVTSSI